MIPRFGILSHIALSFPANQNVLEISLKVEMVPLVLVQPVKTSTSSEKKLTRKETFIHFLYENNFIRTKALILGKTLGTT